MPIPTIWIELPLTIVATAVLLLVYVKAPELVLVGGVIVKFASPVCFVGIVKLLKVGATVIAWFPK